MNKIAHIAVRGLVAAVVVALASMGTVAATSGGGKVTVTATMADATPLRNGNIVRAAGVEVGSVESVTLNDRGQAVVNMSVDRSVLPLHTDATATLVPQDLLGERFVQLDQGSAAAPAMSEPYQIDAQHTKNTVDLQDVVDMVDNPTGTALAMMLTTLGEGIGKNPTQTRDAIKALEPAMVQTRELTQVLSEQNQLLSHLVATAQPVAEAVATQRGQSLDRLVGDTTKMLQTTAADRQQINDSLVRLPNTLASAQVTLAHIAGLAPPTTQSLRDLRPITDDLVDVSRELRRFSEATDPALASLRPVLDKGKDMLDELGPVVVDLRSGTGGLKDIARSYHQLADGALSTRLVDLMEFMKGWTLSISDYDAISHYFKAVTPYTPKTLGATAAGPIPGAPRDPMPDLIQNNEPRAGRAPIPGGGAQGVPNEGGPFLPQPPHGNGAGGPSGGSGALGLSPEQENGMMDQLMGGN